MAYIKQCHGNTTYVYESKSYWDSEKGQPRSIRKLIGKLDPVTGEVVPTGKRGRKAASAETPEIAGTAESVENIETAEAEDRISELTRSIRERDERIAKLEKENRKLRDVLTKLENHTAQQLETIRQASGKNE